MFLRLYRVPRDGTMLGVQRSASEFDDGG